MPVNRGPLPKSRAGTHAGRKSQRKTAQSTEFSTELVSHVDEGDEVSKRSVKKELEPQTQGNGNGPSAMQQAAQSARGELEAMSMLAGVDYGKLFGCILLQVGWGALIAAMRRGGSIIEALGGSVNWIGILQCAGAAVSGMNQENEF